MGIYKYQSLLGSLASTPLEPHTDIQPSRITLRGYILESCGTRGSKEAKEMDDILKSLWSSCFVLKTPNVSRPTIHIKARQVVSHKTWPIMDLPNSLYEMIIMSHIPLGGTQSRWANLNTLCHSLKVKGQCKKRWSIDLSLSMHNKQISRLRIF